MKTSKVIKRVKNLLRLSTDDSKHILIAAALILKDFPVVDSEVERFKSILLKQVHTRPRKKKVSQKVPEDYDEYLKSDAWYNKRQEVFKMKGKACQKCSNTKGLHVHHSTYKNLFKENLYELFVLCNKCHEEFHKQYGTKNLMIEYTEAFIGNRTRPTFYRNKVGKEWKLSSGEIIKPNRIDPYKIGGKTF